MDHHQSTARVLDALRIPWSMRDAILIHLINAAPYEGCGLLSVSAIVEEDGQRIGEGARWYPGTNIERSAERFRMDPREVTAAGRDMTTRGCRLGAIVHSHLRGPATPSPTDIREAWYPEAVMLIVSLAVQPPVIMAWRLERDGELTTVLPVTLTFVEGT